MCLKQICCTKPIIPVVFLWHIFSTRRVLSRDLIQDMRLRKQCLCTLSDTLLWEESKGNIDLCFWKYSLCRGVELLYRHLINFFLLTMHFHGIRLRRQKGRKEDHPRIERIGRIGRIEKGGRLQSCWKK